MKKEEQSFGCGISVSQKGHALSGWILRIVPLFAMLFATVVAKAAGDGDGVKFNPGVRYSQWAINSRAHDFYANSTAFGLAKYKADGTSVEIKRKDSKNKLDYVPGLVAKSMIEAADYYQDFDWSKPWFASVKEYGDTYYGKVPNGGGSLDDLNAVKLYIGVYNNKNASETDKKNAKTAIGRATEGLIAHNNSYSIQSGTLAGDAVVGGWFHKEAYNNQMWLDGAYMGSALLAQIVNFNGNGSNVFGSANDDWNMVFKQLNIVWNMCWNSTDKLMYHAFEANAGTGTSNSHADTWAGLNGTTKPYTFHSAAYWGRANAWYIFALVDALEAMGKAGRTSDANYTILRNHLQELAAGIVARQTSDGGWYQLLDKTDSFKATSYNGKSASATNYIETSATAIFSAALFKAVRLGLIDAKYKENAKKAFECLVNNYTYLKDGSLEIWGSCRSAGLGGGTDGIYAEGGKKFRDGSNEYYLLGYDVPMVKKIEELTEGKVLGGFIMAATEYERAYQNQDGSAQILFSYDLKPAYDLTQSGATAPKVEVCGTGAANATYQWYDANTDAAVKGATKAQFTPQTTGNYYCEATVGSTSIKTSATNIKVNSNSSADKQKYTVTATAVNGTVEIKDGAGNVVTSGTQVEKGTKLIFTAKANTGYVFDSWTATGGEASGNVYTISSLAADANVTANFTKENTGGGETVETTLFSMVTTATSDVNVVSGYTQTLGGDKATITGGSAVLYNGKDKDAVMITKTEGVKLNGSQNSYMKVTLNKPLAKGDVIAAPGCGSSFYVTSADTKATDVVVNATGYTIPENSDLIGKTVIYFWTGKGKSITITRKTTTPTTTSLVIAVKDVEMNVTDEETRQPEVRVYGIGEKQLTLGTDYTLSFSTDNDNVTINENGVFTAAGSKSNYTEGVTHVTVTATPSAELAGQYTEATETFTFTVRKGKDDPAKYRVKAPGSGETYSPMTPLFNQNKTLAVTLGGWSFTDRDTAPVSKEGLTYGDKNKWADDSSKATWVIKGFDYYLPGLTCQNARQEDGACPLPSETQWYDGKLQKVKGGTVDPMFYVPCSGAYLTVEPKTNGKVSVSVFQNGVFDKSGGVYAYRPQRRVFVLDEAGKVVASEATISATGGKLSVADKSATGDLKDPYKITNYPCNITGLATGPATTGGGKDSNPSPKVEEVMKHFRGMTSFVMTEAGFQNNVYESNIDNKDTWGKSATPNKGADDNVMGSHGWSVLVDAAVTYTFDVKAGKTYYIYNYGSKLGFYGFSFDEAKGQTVKNYEFDEAAANTIELTKAGELATAKVNRAMKAGVWTTCVLPFSLNKQQVDAIFGKTYDRDTPNGTQILYFDRVEGTKAIFVRHAYNNIVAGKPFLIKPAQDVASINTAEVEGYPYVTIENTQPAEWCKGNGYVWMASYSNDLTVKEGDCFISNKDGSFKNFVGDPGTLKGFRGYLKNIGTNGVSEAKKLTVGMGSNVTTDETSAIDGILIDGDMPADSVTAADGKVYNLNGQVVATSYRQFQALPGGVYVVNGKKVVK
ncbi:hypothetical protein ST44_01085 [Prevotella pectinovora]|uniref:Bacterial repeat domain-containing protein n=1 Tax=Prevotella pectinovora TaxID=1602169 RepID=A0A0D0J2K8_9BACT|nr:glycoside hydrolase family 88 protein [Prevotella pectinovora]KIP64733.1 hypothetical protein ST44_01085 [Prevotella pectinovora]